MANDIIDSIREFFGGVSQDDVTKAITKLKHDLKFLKAATEGNLVCGNDKIDFNTAFKILRGVEFSENNFKTCQETSAKYIDVSSKNVAVNSFIDKFKTYSSLRGADGIDLNNPAKFNETFLEFFKTLGLNNKTDINKFLEDFCNANKNEEALKKYGSKLKLIKLNEAHKKYYKQDYAVMRQTPSGAWEPLTPEQAELMSDYLIGKKLVPLKASLLGLSENSSNEDCEKYVEKCKTKYLEAFKNAYGEEDVNELADKYIQGQMKGMECFQVTTALVMMAATVLTDGLASAFLTGAMIAQPLTLIENLTNGDGATWNDVEAHGKLLLENLPWFALGSLGGKIGDEVRAVCKLKGLQSITKQAGKSLDKIMTSVATKADPNLSKLLKKVDILTQTSGVTTEVALDLVTTKCLQEQGLTTYDWVMSFAGALQGTVIQKKLAKVCDNQTRVRLLQESFKELNLNTAEATMIISKMELPIILDDATVTAPKTDGQKPQMGLVDETQGKNNPANDSPLAKPEPKADKVQDVNIKPTQEDIEAFHEKMQQDIEESLNDYEKSQEFPTIESYKEYLEAWAEKCENAYKKYPNGTKIIDKLSFERYIPESKILKFAREAESSPKEVEELLRLKDENGNYYLYSEPQSKESSGGFHAMVEAYKINKQDVIECIREESKSQFFNMYDLAFAIQGYIADKNYYKQIKALDFYEPNVVGQIAQAHAKYPEAIEFFVETDKTRGKYSGSLFNKFEVSEICELYEKYPNAMKILYSLKDQVKLNEYLWKDIEINYISIPEDIIKKIDKNPSAFEDLSKLTYYKEDIDGKLYEQRLDIYQMAEISDFYTENTSQFIQTCVESGTGDLYPQTIKALTELSPEKYPDVYDLIKNGQIRNIDEKRMSVRDYLEFVNTKIEVRKNWPELYDILVTTDNYRKIENVKNLTKAMEDGISSGRYTIKDKEALIERLKYNKDDIIASLHFLLTWAYTPEQSLEILIIDINSPKNNFINGIELHSNQSIEDLLIQKLDKATEFEDISYYIDALNKHYKANNIKPTNDIEKRINAKLTMGLIDDAQGGVVNSIIDAVKNSDIEKVQELLPTIIANKDFATLERCVDEAKDTEILREISKIFRGNPQLKNDPKFREFFDKYQKKWNEHSQDTPEVYNMYTKNSSDNSANMNFETKKAELVSQMKQSQNLNNGINPKYITENSIDILEQMLNNPKFLENKYMASHAEEIIASCNTPEKASLCKKIIENPKLYNIIAKTESLTTMIDNCKTQEITQIRTKTIDDITKMLENNPDLENNANFTSFAAQIIAQTNTPNKYSVASKMMNTPLFYEDINLRKYISFIIDGIKTPEHANGVISVIDELIDIKENHSELWNNHSFAEKRGQLVESAFNVETVKSMRSVMDEIIQISEQHSDLFENEDFSNFIGSIIEKSNTKEQAEAKIIALHNITDIQENNPDLWNNKNFADNIGWIVDSTCSYNSTNMVSVILNNPKVFENNDFSHNIGHFIFDSYRPDMFNQNLKVIKDICGDDFVMPKFENVDSKPKMGLIDEAQPDIEQTKKKTKINEKPQNVVLHNMKAIDDAVSKINDEYLAAEQFLNDEFTKLGLDKIGIFHSRLKSPKSLKDKIVNYLKENPNATLPEAINDVRDAFGARTILASSDYSQHPEVKALIDAGDIRGAILKAAEIQSQPIYEGLKAFIISEADNLTAFSITRLSNYVSEDGIPYLSEAQLANLRQLAASKNIEFNYVERVDENDPLYKVYQAQGIKPTTRSQPSGYTAFQLNFTTKDGKTIEWQCRGDKVNDFAEAEHLPYDIRTHKEGTVKDPKLVRLYEPIDKILTDENHFDDDVYKAYQKYLADYYTHLRKLELGFESTEPKLSDYEVKNVKFDKQLEAKNLMFIHDLTQKVKKGEISQDDAIKIYKENLDLN